jgi:predicted nucleic acid-binding protein
MNLVVDTSVIIAVIANEPEKATLVAQTQGADLFAPRSLYWEVGNAFSAMLKRQRITLEQAKAAIEVYKQIPLNLLEIDLAQALELADRLHIYAYDAYLIACALNLNCPLLTLDGGLSYAAKAAGVDVLEVEETDADVS